VSESTPLARAKIERYSRDIIRDCETWRASLPEASPVGSFAGKISETRRESAGNVRSGGILSARGRVSLNGRISIRRAQRKRELESASGTTGNRRERVIGKGTRPTVFAFLFTVAENRPLYALEEGEERSGRARPIGIGSDELIGAEQRALALHRLD
jgi:hypothetical protein